MASGKKRKNYKVKRRQSKSERRGADKVVKERTPLSERSHFAGKGRGGTVVLIEFEPATDDCQPRQGKLVREH